MNQIVSDEDLFTLAETVWSSVLGLELARADDVEGKIGDTTITSCVQITGDWEGAVTIACSHSLAAKLTAAMFQMEPAELSDEEIRDAMGEVANMTGGNVKGMAPGNNTLTLPTVSEGEEGTLSITKTRQVNRVVGITAGEPVIITVLSRED